MAAENKPDVSGAEGTLSDKQRRLEIAILLDRAAAVARMAKHVTTEMPDPKAPANACAIGAMTILMLLGSPSTEQAGGHAAILLEGAADALRRSAR